MQKRYKIEQVDMEIQTFVFFDVETTGLIQGKVMPRITEIALIAVSRESICHGNRDSLPRILHKLVLPINPQKVIPPNVEHLTSELSLVRINSYINE